MSLNKVASGDKILRRSNSTVSATSKSSKRHSIHSGGKGSGKQVRDFDRSAKDDDDDDDQPDAPRHSSHHIRGQGHSLRAILPQIINEQNRKTYGTWQRQFDFTRTIIGYLLGIHNFFRFPYLCYKFGGVFFIPYVIMMFIVGIPAVFMEFTIGQYYGVGSYVAFTHMSPILSGVSKMLTWSCVINCWMYTVILAWLRIYSNDATSCLKGWEICHEGHYYNSPHCFTGTLDDECNDLTLAAERGHNITEILQNDMIFYNYQCRTVTYYCEAQGWKLDPGLPSCVDDSGKKRSVFERRYHATEEYFYGAILGLQRTSERVRDSVLVHVTLNVTSFSNISKLVESMYASDPNRLEREKRQAQVNPLETVRTFLANMKESSNGTERDMYEEIMNAHVEKQYQEKYWTHKSQRLTTDLTSSSFNELKQLSMTTWIMIAVFLFEDLLKISFLSYILNAVPFIILIYVSIISVNFNYSGYGIEQIFAVKQGFFADLSYWEVWCEAVIQVIYTTGIGNGVLISLATYNNLNHNYIVDLYATLILAIITSFCGVIITFCSLGHYLKLYNIDIPFREYIKSESESSVDFCLIVYSIFLTLISDQSVTIILFFFMLTSFATDTAIRLVQSVLDTVMDVSARFKHHSAMVLVAVCLMGYLSLVPMFKNGAFAIFVDFEYFTLRYVMPTIVLVEMGSCVLIYKASRIIDHSEQMGVFSSYSFRTLMIIFMYLGVAAILTTIILNICSHQTIRFNGKQAETYTEIFGWVLLASPLTMGILSVVKQLIMVPPSRWGWLLMPLKGKDRKVRRAFLRRIKGGEPGHGDGLKTDQEDIRDAALRWRQLESRLILAMMAKRKEEKDKENDNEKADSEGKNSKDTSNEQNKATLLASLTKIAATVEKEDEKLFKGGPPAQKGKGDGESEGKVGIIKTDSVFAEKDKKGEDDEDVEREKSASKPLSFSQVKPPSFFNRLVAAFMGKATSAGKVFRPKRHAGGSGNKRIVTRQGADGSKTVNLEAEDDEQSEESLSHDDEDGDEKLREKYLDVMDYLERWPGRFDESDIESEGSSLENDSEEEDFY